MGKTKERHSLAAWRAKALQEAQHKRRKRHYGPYAPFGRPGSGGNYKMVDRFDNMKVFVYGRDHAPPHFHVVGAEKESLYTILECEFMEGKLRLYYRALYDWWLDHRVKTAELWNEIYSDEGTYPGPVKIPKSWRKLC